MIEILILYIIHKREKTLYAIRKEIIEVFGTFTKPSIGTIYPALQRLLKEKAVTVTDRISEGGKKSSYFSITKRGFEYFKELFFNSASDNPSLFYTQLQARFGTMGLLKVEDRKEFLKEFSRKIDIYQFELENKLKDEFLDLDYYQRELLNRTLSELNSLKDYIKYIKTDIV
ncbi:MAG: PadR family transcriptional regulator [Candidatus Gastranaerophilales bacterium]|nr:PadR family transcriptional regulator [Candidatus Gastranaerophilales bacterium]